MKKGSAWIAVVASLFLGGCANMELTHTSFLSDREQLRRAPEHEVDWIPDEVEWYLDERVQLSDYTSLVIEPVRFLQGESGNHSEPSGEDQVYLCRKFGHALAKQLGEDRTLVSEPGPNTLRLRAAITAANPELVWLNILGVLLVVPPDMGGIACELEVVDSESGRRVLGMAAHRDGTIFLLLEAFHEWGHAKHGMKKWAELLRRELSALDSQG